MQLAHASTIFHGKGFKKSFPDMALGRCFPVPTSSMAKIRECGKKTFGSM